MNTKRGSNSRATDFLKRLDIFPLHLGFTHGSVRTYKSASSGLFSMLTLLCILIFFLFMIDDIWNFKVTIKNSFRQRDLIFDTTTFDLSEQNFDFAINVQYMGQRENVTSNLHKYITLDATQTLRYWVETEEGSGLKFQKTSIELDKCTQQSFNEDTKYMNKLGIIGNYYCPMDRQFNLTGSIQNDRSEGLSISMRECDQSKLDEFYPGELCANYSDQQEVASHIMFQLVMTNQYFSGEDKYNPIQNDYKLLTLGSPLNQASYTFIKYSVNYAILKDSWLFESFDNRNISYSSVRVDSQYGRSQVTGSSHTPFLMVVLVLDENVYENERTAFNLITALQSIGGFASVCMVLSRVLFYFTQQFNYYQEIVQTLYAEGKDSNINHLSYKDGEESLRRLDGSSRLPDLEKHESRNSTIIQKLISSLYTSKGPKISFCSFITIGCRIRSGKSVIFKKGKDLLQKELSLENYVKRMRMMELFLKLKLSPLQHRILKGITSKVILKDDFEEENDSNLSINIRLLNQSLAELTRVNEEQSGNVFDAKLAKYLGLEFQTDEGKNKCFKAKRNDINKHDSLQGNFQLKKKHNLGFKKLKKGATGLRDIMNEEDFPKHEKKKKKNTFNKLKSKGQKPYESSSN